MVFVLYIILIDNIIYFVDLFNCINYQVIHI
jgi:hypothetical protein